MTCSVKVIEDSIGEGGVRLTTVQLRYWRAIHAELMTHRVFSRNASSSRAIPVKTMIAQVWNDPAGPIHWGANQPGMQAGKELEGFKLSLAKFCWRIAGKAAASVAWVMSKVGLHKQVANRILEPFQYIQVVVTATEFDNFFDLRCHPDAQPEIQELAVAMRDAQVASTPKTLGADEWHLPYVTDYERQNGYWKGKELELVKISAARCARVSYLLHDGAIPDIAKDLALYERLVGSVPLHASPVEHQAQPDVCETGYLDSQAPRRWLYPELHGNFKGWKQYRKSLELQFA